MYILYFICLEFLLSARLARAFYLACHHQCRAASPGRRPRRAVSAVSMAFPAKKILRSRPNIIRKHSRRVKLLWHQIPVSALSRHERSRWLLYQAQHDTMRRTAGTSRLRPGMCPGLRFAFLADLSAQMGPPITVPGSCILLSARLVRAFLFGLPSSVPGGRSRQTAHRAVSASMFRRACQALDVFQGDQLGKDRVRNSRTAASGSVFSTRPNTRPLLSTSPTA